MTSEPTSNPGKKNCPYCGKEYKIAGCTNHIRSAHPVQYILHLDFQRALYGHRIKYLEYDIEEIKKNGKLNSRLEELLTRSKNQPSKYSSTVHTDIGDISIDIDDSNHDWSLYEDKYFNTFAQETLKKEEQTFINGAKSQHSVEDIKKCLQYLNDGFEYQKNGFDKYWNKVSFSNLTKEQLLQYVIIRRVV